MPYHEDNSQDLLDSEDEILVPHTNLNAFIGMICLTTVLYFGLHVAKWWFAPPSNYFPAPIVQVSQAVTPTAAFPNGNYYVVPQDFTCQHKRTGNILKVTCVPVAPGDGTQYKVTLK